MQFIYISHRSMKSVFLIVTILLACKGFSQDTTSWEKHVIDNIVTLNLPDGDLEIIHPFEGFTVYRARYGDSVNFLFTKLDITGTAPMADDSDDLKHLYRKLLQGFIMNSKSQLIDTSLFNEGKFIGSYLKGKKNNEGVDCYLEYKAYFLNEDTYGIQILYPISRELALTDMRKKLLNSMIISPSVIQTKSAVKKK